MSYYYHFTPDERNEIVEKLFAYLLKCRDNKKLTTCKLLRKTGYKVNRFRQEDVLKIHGALFEKAEESDSICLEPKSYGELPNGLLRPVGMPHNLEYTVHKKV